MADTNISDDLAAENDDGLVPREVRLHLVSGQPMPSNVLASSLARIRESLDLGLKPLLQSVSTSSGQMLLALTSAVDWSEVFRPVREALPANWPGDPDWEAALEIMNDGIPLMWVPREEIVTALMRADDGPARRDVLVQRAAEIIVDCQATLGEVEAAELRPLAGLTGDACKAMADGHRAASQALAANVFDTWLRQAARRGVRLQLPANGWFAYKNVRGQLEPVTGDVSLRNLRAEGALAPAFMALAAFDGADAVPAEFTRHATAHAAGPEQYNDANAVIALMLASSVLRQAQASGW